MSDSFAKRQRERNKQQKKREKEARKQDKSEVKSEPPAEGLTWFDLVGEAGGAERGDAGADAELEGKQQRATAAKAARATTPNDKSRESDKPAK
jgi:hypothetical protein